MTFGYLWISKGMILVSESTYRMVPSGGHVLTQQPKVSASVTSTAVLKPGIFGANRVIRLIVSPISKINKKKQLVGFDPDFGG